MRLHIGLDDTDSLRGGCTTYIVTRLVEEFLALGARFRDYPNLLRLNPNVPWKTRGNGATCLRIEVNPENGGPIKRAVLRAMEAHSEFWCDNTNPGVVFLEGDIPDEIGSYSDRVIQSVVTLGEALELIDEYGATAVGYKNMRGIIGGLAAVGGLQRGDHTFELLSYRMQGNRGKPRIIDADSVRAMDETTDSTFNNIDKETGRVLIAPHGPDPVLFGVRGETPEAVHRAAEMIDPGEPVERWVIFRTNQGTDAHLRSLLKVSEIKPYNPAIADGKVVRKPKTIKGGHVILGIGDRTGLMDCAAYEPTGDFRDMVRHLIPGDEIRAYGGVRKSIRSRPKTLNLEKLEVLRLASEVVLVNPTCPACGGRMKSMGRGKGYRCRRCSLRDSSLRKQVEERERNLRPGLYMPPPRAQRHLTKPIVRYGREKKNFKHGNLYEPWHWP